MPSRRMVITSMAGAALGSAGPIIAVDAQAAAPRRVGTPRTMSAHRAVRGGRLRIVRTEFALSHLGVTWGGMPAQLRVRTAHGWGPWRQLGGCTDGTALVAVPGGIGYEVWVAARGTAQVTELNTVDGPAAGALATAVASSMPLPGALPCDVPFLTRAAWGADESLRFPGGVEDWPATYHAVQTLTVHHTATSNNDPAPAATVRAIYNMQAVSKAWGDIGYHLMIDEAGRVYEGRWSGGDGLPVFGTPGWARERPTMTTGAHVKNYNSGNIGVCLIGDLTSRPPTAAARESLARVLAALARACNLDVQGTTSYHDAISGAAKPVRTLSGHRNWAATDCPGDTFYPQLASLRTDVAARVGPLAAHAPRQTTESPRTPTPRRAPGDLP